MNVKYLVLFLGVRICDQAELPQGVSGFVLVDSEGDHSKGQHLVLVPRSQLEIVRRRQTRVTSREHGVSSAQLQI